jgi:hypothetical protein
MEQEFARGWTSALVEAEGAGAIEVKDSAGKVAKIIVNTNGITVTLKDDDTEAWTELSDDAGLDLVTAPMQLNTSIVLDFSAPGSAWILYK